MYKKDVFSKSLQANKDYVNSLTKEQLEEEMKFYDNYEIEQLNMHDVSMRSEQFTDQDSKEFILWQKSIGIKRIHNNIYKWNEFGYERSFFLEKYQEHLNKVN